jgi:hypothetical protein
MIPPPFCSNCGKQTESTANYCGYCGKSLRTKDEIPIAMTEIETLDLTSDNETSKVPKASKALQISTIQHRTKVAQGIPSREETRTTVAAARSDSIQRTTTKTKHDKQILLLVKIHHVKNIQTDQGDRFDSEDMLRTYLLLYKILSDYYRNRTSSC